MKSDRRHTSTILNDLRNRLIEVVYENGREDLADAVNLLCELACANSAALRSNRSRMLSILAEDDALVETAKWLAEYEAQRSSLINQAVFEWHFLTALH